MRVSGQRHAPAALYPLGKDSDTGGWVGPRTGQDAGATRKILCPCRGSNPDRLARSQTLYYLSYRGSPLLRLLKWQSNCFETIWPGTAVAEIRMAEERKMYFWVVILCYVVTWKAEPNVLEKELCWIVLPSSGHRPMSAFSVVVLLHSALFT
jgi:hypothetical protein